MGLALFFLCGFYLYGILFLRKKWVIKLKKIFIVLSLIFIGLLVSCSFDEDSMEEYIITIKHNIENGNIYSNKERAKKGEAVELSNIPFSGYELAYYTIDGIRCDESTFLMPANDVEISAKFVEVLYTITINSDKVSVDKKSAKVNEVVEVAVELSDDEELNCIYVNGIAIEGYSFVMPNEDIIITVSISKVDRPCSHSYEEKILKNPDCKSTGLKEFKCSLCDYSYTEVIEVVDHNYVKGVCSYCKEVRVGNYLYEIYGDDITLYSNEDENPYNIDLDKYGSDVLAYFYDPNPKGDMYANVSKTSFYNSYEVARTYDEAYYRTQHNFMSGDISDQYYTPTEGKIVIDDCAVRITTAIYVLSTTGDYIAYVPNTPFTEDYIIYYGAAYTSLNEVAAYLLAFGEVPVNSNYNKDSGRTKAISTWGKYGRVNNMHFSGDTSKYPYEPYLPYVDTRYYIETDFGTTGGYSNINPITGTSYTQTVYNNGSSISRGAARFVFVGDYNITSIDDRYVFYTYNHYNDFQEYLNYHNGWGYRFGNESAGNYYCGGDDDYYATATSEPTQYVDIILKSYLEINLS